MEKNICDHCIATMDKMYRQAMRSLWLARAERALMTVEYFTMKCRWFKDVMKIEPPACDVQMIKKWAWAERKCREKAKEFE